MIVIYTVNLYYHVFCFKVMKRCSNCFSNNIKSFPFTTSYYEKRIEMVDCLVREESGYLRWGTKEKVYHDLVGYSGNAHYCADCGEL